jgi:hypothetical protein
LNRQKCLIHELLKEINRRCRSELKPLKVQLSGVYFNSEKLRKAEPGKAGSGRGWAKANKKIVLPVYAR